MWPTDFTKKYSYFLFLPTINWNKVNKKKRKKVAAHLDLAV